MQRGPAGTFVERHIGGERVRTFAPYPLPPDPGPQITGDRARLHEQALLACGRLDAITMLLPEPDLFLYAYVRREALVSSQIEGTQSSFSDLLLFELEEAAGVPFHDVVEVSNYVAALDHGLARIGRDFRSPIDSFARCTHTSSHAGGVPKGSLGRFDAVRTGSEALARGTPTSCLLPGKRSRTTWRGWNASFTTVSCPSPPW